MTTNEKPVVFAKCKRGNDKATAGQECRCMNARNMSEPGSHVVILQCTKCNYQWNVPVGGMTPY